MQRLQIQSRNWMRWSRTMLECTFQSMHLLRETRNESNSKTMGSSRRCSSRPLALLEWGYRGVSTRLCVCKSVRFIAERMQQMLICPIESRQVQWHALVALWHLRAVDKKFPAWSIDQADIVEPNVNIEYHKLLHVLCLALKNRHGLSCKCINVKNI